MITAAQAVAAMPVMLLTQLVASPTTLQRAKDAAPTALAAVGNGSPTQTRLTTPKPTTAPGFDPPANHLKLMQTNQTTTAAAPQTMHVFRKQEHEREFVWIYKGEVDVETKETTFGQLLPSDRVSNYFPEENYECEEMPEAGGMICSI